MKRNKFKFCLKAFPLWSVRRASINELSRSAVFFLLIHQYMFTQTHVSPERLFNEKHCQFELNLTVPLTEVSSLFLFTARGEPVGLLFLHFPWIPGSEGWVPWDAGGNYQRPNTKGGVRPNTHPLLSQEMTESSQKEGKMKDHMRGKAEDTQPSESEQEQARYAQSKA